MQWRYMQIVSESDSGVFVSQVSDAIPEPTRRIFRDDTGQIHVVLSPFTFEK